MDRAEVITISRLGKWRLYWPGPLPQGAAAIGTVNRGNGEEGALILMPTGVYVQGNAGALRSLPQREIRAALDLPARGGNVSAYLPADVYHGLTTSAASAGLSINAALTLAVRAWISAAGK
ncbi:MAG TPA: hypothetical protein PKN49_12105 [Candidatus Aminicenantes bacterium]|nr:hypothetical protein [Candidatus Aminicenantes bacterium]